MFKSVILIQIILLGASVIYFSCSGAHLSRYAAPGESNDGYAVYYADKYHGKKTASGEIYDKNKLTAAHRHLAFGTLVLVTNLNNFKKVQVKINDRGPFGKKNRIIDLSKEAAQRIDMISKGVIPVKIEILKSP